MDGAVAVDCITLTKPLQFDCNKYLYQFQYGTIHFIHTIIFNWRQSEILGFFHRIAIKLRFFVKLNDGNTPALGVKKSIVTMCYDYAITVSYEKQQKWNMLYWFQKGFSLLSKIIINFLFNVHQIRSNGDIMFFYVLNSF